MATEKFTSREGEGLYRLVVLLNGSLRLVVMRLEELATLKILSPEYLRELKRLTDKIEKEITNELPR
ncbi:MAG TPA: hypothetical protein VIB39_11400 [Candidatus Angelobacter sp.]